VEREKGVAGVQLAAQKRLHPQLLEDRLAASRRVGRLLQRLITRRLIRLGTRQLDQQRGILDRQAQSIKRLDERPFAVGFADYISRRCGIIPEFRGRRLRIQLI
jgi:hypothetical protein